MSLRILLPFLLSVLLPTAAAEAAGYVLLEPARGPDGRALTRVGPEGKPLPVVRRLTPGPLADSARQILSTGFSALIPGIDAKARAAAVRKTDCPAVGNGPIILFSDEDGGFARKDFFLAGGAGEPSLCRDYYVDVTADQASLSSGEFEEVLAHEWGHVLFRRLLGPVPPTPSRNFHHVDAITDPVTAFDEGFGIHLQPVALQLTATPGFRARAEGARPSSAADFWFSLRETWMRQTWVPQNRFVFAKQASAGAADLYARWMSEELSANLDPCRLRNGNQLMASEGFAATFFYKLLAGVPADGARSPQQLADGYAKLVPVLARLGSWPGGSAPLIALVRAWGEVHPADRERVTALFVATSYGATVSDKLHSLHAATACKGASGDIEAFLAARKDAQATEAGLLADVAAQRVALDAALAPSLWLTNPEVRVAKAPWQGKRELPFTVDLNTADESGLRLLFSGTAITDAALRRVVAARNVGGAFRSFDDLSERSGLAAPERQAVDSMKAAFAALPTYVRE